jgi:hypothetical protein
MVSLRDTPPTDRRHSRAKVSDGDKSARKGGERSLRRPYRAPRLIEYGRITQLTLGSSANKPDYQFTGSTLVDTDTDCNATDPNVTGCIVVS